MKPLHPALVHFPIAWLVLQVALCWIWRFRPTWLTKSILLGSQVLATSALFPALISGTWEEDQLRELNQQAQSMVEQHELMAYGLAFSCGLLLVWLYLRYDRWTQTENTIFCLSQTLNLVLVLLTAHWGGNLVYLFGLGTNIR